MADEYEERARSQLLSEVDADKLAVGLERQATTVCRVAAALLHEPDEDLRAVASFVLGESQELAIDPLIAVSGLEPLDRAWLLRSIVSEETSLRSDTLAWLGILLKDKTPVAENETRRICDEAFLSLRQLISFDEAELGAGLDVKRFLAEPPVKRDQLINKALVSKTYRRASGAED